ncbi:type II toxin-antitoxin system VapC family toxin [Candidatus Poriferisodalis sp.]|uniref:type II toxin-antitoxin system VapC family toxin n=1 Tax=Candidatus Poriferisodalis sp. TaxID=3101277 RepID=UPI003B019D81
MSGTDPTGLVIVDAGVVIGHLDRANPHHHAATRALSEAALTAERLMLPLTAFAECLVYPAQAGDDAASRFEAALGAIPIGILDADVATARCAAGLRANHRSVKLPDAFVIATAIVHGADVLLTTDRGWPNSLTRSLAFEIHVV